MVGRFSFIKPRATSKETFENNFSSNKFFSAINPSKNSSPDKFKKYTCG